MKSLVTIAIIICVAYIYASVVPPPPKGFQVTSPRVKLRDGRHLSYRELGVPRDTAAYKFVVSHGFASSKYMDLRVSNDTIQKLGLYFVFFDRPGYGESDPDPARTVKSASYDIQELADQLNLGRTFYIIGVSLGSSSVYSCLHYIPHRLAGAVLVSPFINFWWTKIPEDVLYSAFELMPEGDQLTYKVAHYAPDLLYWWFNQKLFPSKILHSTDRALASDRDLAVDDYKSQHPTPGSEKSLQQGDHESLHRDLIVGFGTWEFDPTELKNPFATRNGSVHIWRGTQDRIIPRKVPEYISNALSWIKYHEVPDYGHLLNYEEMICEDVIKKLLVEI